MLLLLAGNLVIMAGSLLTLFSGNMFLFITVGLILILVFGILFWTGKMKKKESHEVIHPITDYIGNLSERVAELNDELEPFGFAYEPYQDIFYSLQYPWQRELGYCKLYDEGFKRLGCIGCPMADKGRISQFERYPKYKETYIRAIKRFMPGHLARKKAKGKEPIFTTAEEMMEWWLYGTIRNKVIEGQINLFEEEE